MSTHTTSLTPDDQKARILNGIAHFEAIPPSKWNAATISHAKFLFRLMETYLHGHAITAHDLKEEPRMVVEDAQKVFYGNASTSGFKQDNNV